MNGKRPNIVYIYTDQQRRDTLGCYGCQAIKTPHLDALANDGTVLESYFVQNPVCAPSRMSFLSGRYCSSLGVGTNGISFPSRTVPIWQLLSPYGYHTAQIGKLHFDPHARRNHKDPTDRYGFDTFILSDEPGCYDDAYTKWVELHAPEQLTQIRTALPPAAKRWHKTEYSTVPRETHEPYFFAGSPELTHTAFVTQESCQYLETRSDSQPFFLIAGYYAPHTPINPPKKYYDLVDKSKITLPVLGDEEQFAPFLSTITPNGWREIIASYLAMVLQIDEGVGRIVETLKRKGLYDDTVIVFTSDHGEFLGDHGRIQKGMPGHDCIINVPCILKGTGHQIPRTNALIEAVDIAPTILDFCGIQTPSYMQGRSIHPLLHQGGSHKEEVLVEFFEPEGVVQTSVRTKSHKYYISSSGEQLIYDLNTDPKELHPLSLESVDCGILAGLRLHMLQAMQRACYTSCEQTDEY